MARRSAPRLQFEAIRVEGGLILPDLIAKIAAGDAEGQSEVSYDVQPGLKLRDELGRYWQIARTLWQRYEVGRGGPRPHDVQRAFARDLLTRVLGFSLEDRPGAVSAGIGFSVAFANGGTVPVVIAGILGLDEP